MASEAKTLIRIKGILCDLDGTMVDSVPDIHPAINKMLTNLGMSPYDVDTVRNWVGNGASRLVHRALTGDHEGSADADEHQKALALYMEYYRQDVCRLSYPYQGVIETLDLFSQNGFIIGCVTNKPASHTLPVLEKLDMFAYFKVIVCGDTLEKRKPDPEPLFYACHNMGIDHDSCLMIGDSVSDIKAAQAASMPVFCVNYGYNQGVDLASLLLSYDALIDDFTYVPAKIELA